MFTLVKNHLLMIVFVFFVVVGVNNPQPVFAGIVGNATKKLTNTSSFGSIFVDSGKKTTISEVIAKIIYYILSFLGVLFVILLIYAGFLWMSARGDTEQITRAKETMQSSIIGIVIILSSYTITYFVIKNLTIATETYY